MYQNFSLHSLFTRFLGFVANNISSTYLSVCLPVCLPARLSVRLSVSLSGWFPPFPVFSLTTIFCFVDVIPASHPVVSWVVFRPTSESSHHKKRVVKPRLDQRSLNHGSSCRNEEQAQWMASADSGAKHARNFPRNLVSDEQLYLQSGISVEPSATDHAPTAPPPHLRHARNQKATAGGVELGRCVGSPKPALGENGTSFPLAISSQTRDQLPDESCTISPAQTSLVSGDPPIMNNLWLRER